MSDISLAAKPAALPFVSVTATPTPRPRDVFLPGDSRRQSRLCTLRRRLRWPLGVYTPNARGRLEQAALELYTERGFDRTTVAEIAERAGLTERTFFRTDRQTHRRNSGCGLQGRLRSMGERHHGH